MQRKQIFLLGLLAALNLTGLGLLAEMVLGPAPAQPSDQVVLITPLVIAQRQAGAPYVRNGGVYTGASDAAAADPNIELGGADDRGIPNGDPALDSMGANLESGAPWGTGSEQPGFDFSNIGGYPAPGGSSGSYDNFYPGPGGGQGGAITPLVTQAPGDGMIYNTPEPLETFAEPPDSGNPTAGPTQPQPTSTPGQPAPTSTRAPAQPTSTPVQATHTPESATSTPTKATSTAQPATPTAKAPVPASDSQLVALPAGEAPTLDGQVNDPAWQSAPALTIETRGGANQSASTVTLKAVYDAERVYFQVQWTDPTASLLRLPWEMQADGRWKQLRDPEHSSGDETVYYEDNLAFMWPTGDWAAQFGSSGCGGACHTGEQNDSKPVGVMSAPKGQVADLWHWKAVRGNAGAVPGQGQVDDQYLDDNRYSKDSVGAGFHSDPGEGGWQPNQTDDRRAPQYMAENNSPNGAPGFINEAAKILLDPALFKPGDRLPSVLAAPYSGDRGDLSAAWSYQNGTWTLEFSRKLVTGSAVDVQFTDLNQAYPFSVATFDNNQIRHAAQDGTAVLIFKK